jgi:Beta-lactamase
MQGERIHTEIEAAADELIASGAETGLQVAVVKDGQVVADVARGVADPRTGAAVSGGTLFYAARPRPGPARRSGWWGPTAPWPTPTSIPASRWP